MRGGREERRGEERRDERRGEERSEESVNAVGAAFVVEDRRIKFVLRRKVPEHHRLRHARRTRDLLRRRALKAALRKKFDRRLQYLLSALVAFHPADGFAVYWFADQNFSCA